MIRTVLLRKAHRLPVECQIPKVGVLPHLDLAKSTAPRGLLEALLKQVQE